MGNERVEGYAEGFKVGWDKGVKEVLEEIEEKFFYHSDIDGVTLKLNELQEFQDFKDDKLTLLTGEKK